MSSPPPRVVRTKTTELAVIDDTRFHLIARLTDVSYDCDYGGGAGTGEGAAVASATVHDFTVEGDLEGDDLVITALDIGAQTHPYQGCPAVVPRCRALVGHSLASGWRRTVLDLLGGEGGCTHVTTLLLGLAEVRTSAFFLRMNARVPYTPRSREDGRWTAAGLAVAPGIVGACHVLTRSGPVVTRALRPDPDNPPPSPTV